MHGIILLPGGMSYEKISRDHRFQFLDNIFMSLDFVTIQVKTVKTLVKYFYPRANDIFNA